jgi:hypothetical protein
MSLDPKVEALFDDANGDLAIGELSAAIDKYRRCVEMAPDFFDGRVSRCFTSGIIRSKKPKQRAPRPGFSHGAAKSLKRRVSEVFPYDSH